MNKASTKIKNISFVAFIGVASLFLVVNVNAQGTRHKRKPTVPQQSVPVAASTEPQIISRADDYADPAGQAIPVNSNTNQQGSSSDDNSKTIEDLRKRVRNLESPKKNDQDENQKRLLLDLDILTRAEQRADGLRKQLFEMIEKESTIRTKLDQIENDIRPEAIDREIAFAGTMRPEELRNMRQKNLEIERTNLTALLAEVQKTKANIDQNVQKADVLVDRFRLKLEKEMDDILNSTDPKP